MGSAVITLVLPFPPSINHYYGVVQRGPCAGKVYLLPAAITYRKRVNHAVAKQLGQDRPALMGRLAVKVELNEPDDGHTRDIPNYDKGLLDALTIAGVWGDDAQIDYFQVQRGRVIRGGRCVLQVVETSPAREQLSLLEPV